MGWIDKAKEIIGKMRASGKSNEEVKEIVTVAADKATANKQMEQLQQLESKILENTEKTLRDTQVKDEWGEFGRKMFDAANIAGTIIPPNLRVNMYATGGLVWNWNRAEWMMSNNYRKMHGLPMRRRQAMRRNDSNGNRKRANGH